MLLHPLPVKPAFLGPVPTSTSLVSAGQPEDLLATGNATAGPSRIVIPTATADPTKCAICAQPPKYTCPRCSLRTCSLSCSTGHKDKYSCTGVRAAEGFVSLKTYGQGEWAEDYRYLEESRRRVTEWGKGIKGEEMDVSSGNGAAASGRGRGDGARGRGRGQGGRGDDGRARMRKGKTHALQMELRARGVWAEFMPDGMGRRNINQSSWNRQTGILNLSVQFNISHKLLPLEQSPGAALPGSIKDEEPAPAPLNSANSTNAALPIVVAAAGYAPLAGHPSKTVLHPRVLLVHPKSTLPTLSALLATPPTPIFSVSADDIVFVLPFHPSPARPSPPADPSRASKLFFPPLDPTRPISEVIKGVAWVEFPTIHVLARDEWEKGLQEGRYGVVPLAQPRKWGTAQGGDSGLAAAFEPGAEARETRQDPLGKRRRASETGLAPQAAVVDEPIAKRADVASGPHDAAQGALGVLGDYASDEEVDGDIGDDDVAEVGAEQAEAGLVGAGADDGDVDYDDEDDLVILDEQPGSAPLKLDGLPPDLLVAMSHAIDADLA